MHSKLVKLLREPDIVSAAIIGGVIALLAMTILSLSGCGPQAVLVNPGHVVRLADPVSARIYVPNGSGGYVVSQNTVTIPAGWYAAPPPSTQPATQTSR